MNKTIARSRSNGSFPIRVLMADPDEALPPVYHNPLLREGFELVTAASGLECVSRLRERLPDVLVLEPHLPWGGGDGVLALMAEDSDLAAVPVMVLTSCHDPHVLKGVGRFPINDYQLKPLAPDRFVGKLRALLNHPRVCFNLAEQAGHLECLITRRTGGRVGNLNVETVDGRVIVHGRVYSHHVRQLALAAILEAFEASPSQSERVELDIEVVSVSDRLFRQCASTGTRDQCFSE